MLGPDLPLPCCRLFSPRQRPINWRHLQTVTAGTYFHIIAKNSAGKSSFFDVLDSEG